MAVFNGKIYNDGSFEIQSEQEETTNEPVTEIGESAGSADAGNGSPTESGSSEGSEESGSGNSEEV